MLLKTTTYTSKHRFDMDLEVARMSMNISSSQPQGGTRD